MKTPGPALCSFMLHTSERTDFYDREVFSESMFGNVCARGRVYVYVERCQVTMEGVGVEQECLVK